MIDSLEVTIIEPAVSCNEKFDEVFVTISDQSVRGEKPCVAFTPSPKMSSLVELTGAWLPNLVWLVLLCSKLPFWRL